MSSSPTDKLHIRESIMHTSEQAVANEPRIHYSQQRPFRFYDEIGRGQVVLDCSGFVGNVFWNAMHDLGLFIHDPLDERFSGFGNTGTMELYLRAHAKKVTEVNGYLVGDITRYGQGQHAHTTVCTKSGTAETARWTSHGREAGPMVVKLHYRTDLVGVWRHPVLL